MSEEGMINLRDSTVSQVDRTWFGPSKPLKVFSTLKLGLIESKYLLLLHFQPFFMHEVFPKSNQRLEINFVIYCQGNYSIEANSFRGHTCAIPREEWEEHPKRRH